MKPELDYRAACTNSWDTLLLRIGLLKLTHYCPTQVRPMLPHERATYYRKSDLSTSCWSWRIDCTSAPPELKLVWTPDLAGLGLGSRLKRCGSGLSHSWSVSFPCMIWLSARGWHTPVKIAAEDATQYCAYESLDM